MFLKVYRKASELRQAERFLGWMYAIARNELVSHWRRQKSRIAETQLGNLIAEMCDSTLMEAEVMPKLRLTEWVDALEACDRDLLILRFVDDLSYQELAIALNIPVGTVKWRISELRRKLSLIIHPSTSLTEVKDHKRHLRAVWETNRETRNKRRRMGRLSDGQEHAGSKCPA